MTMLILLLSLAVQMTAPKEPGIPLLISGQVFDASGSAPVAGITVYAYQTDATGVYNRQGVDEPRIKATVVTDAQGRFELQTIRPASYPGGNSPPAHIHFQLSGAGHAKQYADLEFSDDPGLSAAHKAASRAKGKFSGVVTPVRDRNGVLRVQFNVRLKS